MHRHVWFFRLSAAANEHSPTSGRWPGLALSTLHRSLKLLMEKRVVAADQPLSAAASSASNKRYRVEDPYLRFWLSFLGRT